MAVFEKTPRKVQVGMCSVNGAGFLLEKTKKITDLLSRWYVPVQKETKLPLEFPAVERFFLSGLGGIVNSFYLGTGYRTMCM